MNNEVSQNIMQAKDARMMVMASGGTSDDSRYLNTGMLIPKRTFAVNIRMCPLIGLPNVVMDSALYVNLFLLGQEGVFGEIAHRQQAGEFIVIGGSDYLLDFSRFITHGDVKHGSQSFIRGCKKHVFNGTPYGCEEIERALFLRLKQRALALAEEGQD